MEAHLHSGSTDSDALCFVLGHRCHNFSWNLNLRWHWKPFFSLAFTRPACLLHPSWPIGFLTGIDMMDWNIASVVWWRSEGRPMTKGSLRFSILAVKGRDGPQNSPAKWELHFSFSVGAKSDVTPLFSRHVPIWWLVKWDDTRSVPFYCKKSHFTDGIYYLNLAWKMQSQDSDPRSLAPESVFLIYYKSTLLLLKANNFIYS